MPIQSEGFSSIAVKNEVFMKKLMTITALLILSSCAHAELVGFQFSGLTGTTKNAERIYLNQNEDGKLQIDVNNQSEVVEAKILVDGRPYDGNLELKLSSNKTLTVTSGFRSGVIKYFLTIDKEKIELSPVVYIDIK